MALHLHPLNAIIITFSESRCISTGFFIFPAEFNLHLYYLNDILLNEANKCSEPCRPGSGHNFRPAVQKEKKDEHGSE